MHAFTELADRSARFTLAQLAEAHDAIVEALQTSGATSLVKSLQMIQLQKAIMAVGMFSIFEAMLQDSLGCSNGFAEARQILDHEGERDLRTKFSRFASAINVLKHGRGRSYDELVDESGALPFRIKLPDEAAFFEGDVGEVATLVEVDDAFVLSCADVIREVSNVILRSRPGCGL